MQRRLVNEAGNANRDLVLDQVRRPINRSLGSLAKFWMAMFLLSLLSSSQRIGGVDGFLSAVRVSGSHFRSARTIQLHMSTFEKSALSIMAGANSTKEQSQLPSVILQRNRRTKEFRDGSQLVFSKSIDKIPPSLRMGDLVQVEIPSESGNGKHNDKNHPTTHAPPVIVGWGVYNPESMYRVRILSHCLLHPEMTSIVATSSSNGNGRVGETILQALLTMRFLRSLHTRRVLGLPSPTTDTFRMVNGEGDSLSGLAVDIIANKVAVIMSSAAWCEIQKDVILQSLHEVIPTHQLVWKTTPSRLKQDGYEFSDVNNVQEQLEEQCGETIIALENGVKYLTSPHLRGQKTGVYCDQRENRWSLAQLCSEKNVLDLCCYHGGFSLNAAMHGAKRVVGVDSSGDAIETCIANAALNDFCNGSDISFVKSDITDFMKVCVDKYQVVVLDPPKLAPSVSALQRATRKYHSLNRDAIKLIDDDGGLLLTCTCSAAMTQKDGGRLFLETVQRASLAARREVTLLNVSGAARCHTQSPISFPAGNYLTAALFMVHPASRG
jgi:23S rRNA (cytosine1962-C5)-methyltransferase